jgi:hypothetical protein
MFARFCRTARRLQVSLTLPALPAARCATSTSASLSSVPLAMTTADRMTFWAELHLRLQRLANRLDATQQHHGCGPRPHPDADAG